MHLPSLQSRLETHYDLHLPYDVEQFISHDRDVAWQLASATAMAECDIEGQTLSDEVVFIRQDEHNLEFTVFFDPELMQSVQIQERPPLDHLCTVVEGVSHAVCLLWHAHHERQIRPLDLELQAEIDKYVILTEGCGSVVQRRRLHEQLFERSTLTAPAGSDLHERYHKANHFAAQYCQWLDQRYIEPMAAGALHQELARFYRLSGGAKMDYIRRLH